MTIPDHIAFIDLETLPKDATVGMDLTTAPGWEAPDWRELVAEPERRKCPSNYGDKAAAGWAVKERVRYTQAVEDADTKAQESVGTLREAAAKEWRKGSLSGFRGRIACISIAFGEGPVEVLDCAEDEERALMGLGALAVPADGKRKTWVAHNGFGFDFPMLQLRALAHGSTRLARRFHQDKPWDGVLIDTADWWPSLGGWSGGRSGSKLGDICAHLGIDHDEDNPISGAEVLDAYVRGDWQDVIDHARADVRNLREVYRVLKAVRG